jgi:hypothetical protein
MCQGGGGMRAMRWRFETLGCAYCEFFHVAKYLKGAESGGGAEDISSCS